MLYMEVGQARLAFIFGRIDVAFYCVEGISFLLNYPYFPFN